MAISIPLIQIMCPCCEKSTQLQLHEKLNEQMTRCPHCKNFLMCWPEIKECVNVVAISVRVLALGEEWSKKIANEKEGKQKYQQQLDRLFEQAS